MLYSTMSLVTTINSLLAISAGLVSNLLSENLQLGPLAPFLLAVPVLLVCATVITTRRVSDVTFSLALKM